MKYIAIAIILVVMILVCGCTNLMTSTPPRLSCEHTCHTDSGIVTSKAEIPNPSIGLYGGGSHYTVTLNNATYEVGEGTFYSVTVNNYATLTRCVCK